MLDFATELEALVVKYRAAGEHGITMAKALVEHAHDALKAEAGVVERHNHQLFDKG